MAQKIIKKTVFHIPKLWQILKCFFVENFIKPFISKEKLLYKNFEDLCKVIFHRCLFL